MKHLRIRLEPDPVMEVHRRSLKATKLVYFLVAPKPVRQTRGRSRILYIGTTGTGVKRMASSAAYRAEEIFATRGVRRLHVFAITCTGKRGLKARWRSMEQAFLAQFCNRYGSLPACNERGRTFFWSSRRDRLYRRAAIDRILEQCEGVSK